MPPRTLMPGAPSDVEASFEPHQQQFQFAQPQLHQGMFATPANPVQELSNGVKTSQSDEDDALHHDRGGKAASQWHRVKWTSDMVKLLVSAVAYIDEDVEMDYGSSRKKKHAMLKRKGKWKLVSMSMNERGFAVSPQQCEDKFNDLNKRYKRLTEILGRGTTCQIVENPQLLEGVSLSGKLKEEARKLLSSKHLHYEEMCSYHNQNRLCLLEDPVLQKSLRLALRSKDDHEKKSSIGDDDEDDEMMLSDDDEEDDEFNDDTEASAEDHHHRSHGTERLQLDYGETWSGSHLSEVAAIDMNKMLCERSGGLSAEKDSPGTHEIQILKQHLKLKAQMLKFKQRQFKWLRFSKEKDRELEKMRRENEKMRLENERLELELTLKGLEMGIKPKIVIGDWKW